MVQPLHPNVREKESWRAVVGATGDLGPVKWGMGPWPAELGQVLKAWVLITVYPRGELIIKTRDEEHI